MKKYSIKILWVLLMVVLIGLVYLAFNYQPSTNSDSYTTADEAGYLFNWPPEEWIKEHAGCFEEVIINGERFCLLTTSDGAAGHIYTEYTYSTLDTDIEQAYTFTTRFVSDCGIYEGAAVQQCEQEKAEFDPDELFYEYYRTLEK
ncbi:MAG: hypothetical protein ABH826_04595 [Patescibacteria group bacterium]